MLVFIVDIFSNRVCEIALGKLALPSHTPRSLYCCPFQGRYSDVDHFHCNSSNVATRYTAVHFAFSFPVLMLALRVFPSMATHYIFFLYVLLYCLKLHQEIRVRFRASKTGSSPPVFAY